MTRKFLIGGTILGIALAIMCWWFWPRPEPTYLERSSRTSPEINRSLIKELDLRLNGVQFTEPGIEAFLNERMSFTGKLIVDETQLPATSKMYTLIVRLEPKGAWESQWKTTADKMNFAIFTQVDGSINFPRTVRPSVFKPGEYDMRLYLRVDVVNTKNQFVHYLDKGSITILPERPQPETAEPEQKPKTVRAKLQQ